MALDPIAKRIYNVAPDPVAVTFADGSVRELAVRSAEFFQETLEAEATAADDPGAEYRITTTGPDDGSVVVGRRGPDDDGWSVVGRVIAAERA